MRLPVRPLAVAITLAACAPASLVSPPPPPRSAIPSVTPDAAPAGPHKAVAIAMGGGARCVILDDRTSRCWIQVSRDLPIVAPQIPGFTDVVTITTASAFACALRGDGSVVCWGKNDDGELGIGTLAGRHSIFPFPPMNDEPIAPVVGLTDAVELHATRAFACARRRDATVWCWGDNASGQLGDGTKVHRPAPVQAVGVHDVASFALAGDRVLALRADGTLMAWGSGVATPAAVPGLRDAVEIGASSTHSCARRKDGSLWCWGTNADGELGDGTQEDRATPTPVHGLSGVVGMRVGLERTCAWHGDGKVACWGEDTAGAIDCAGVARRKRQYESGFEKWVPDCLEPTVIAGLDGVTRVEMAAHASFALLRSGALRRWGGKGDEGFPSAPRLVVPPPLDGAFVFDPIERPDVVDLAVDGEATACAVTTAGQVYCTDTPTPGPGGVAVTWDSAPVAPSDASPDAAPPVPQHKATAVATADGATRPRRCVILDDRTVHCWETATSRPQRASAVPGLTDAVALGMGKDFVCALRGDGSVRCWGDNEEGELGDGTTRDRARPVPVVGLNDAVELQSDNHFSCVRRRDATVWCWGENHHGQLGDGTKVDRSAPVQAIGVRDVPGFVLSYDHVLALLPDGTLMAWGSGFALGTGSFADRPKPTAVRGLRDVVRVGTNGLHSCAKRKDGSLWCWGSNTDGELGDGTQKDRWLPAPVRGQSHVAGFAVGSSPHTCAWHEDGKVACWGRDTTGYAGCGGLHTVKRQDFQVPPGLEKWELDCLKPTEIAGLEGVARMDDSASIALLRSGSVRLWGDNGSDGWGTEPVLVVSPPEPRDPYQRSDVVGVSASGTCVITASGTVFCAPKGAVTW